MADPPFITLVAGGMQAKSEASIATHDTSRTKYHMSDIGTFAARLENAAASIFPNKGRSRYKKVHVLLLRWEEDTMGVALELEDLAKTFTFVYGFETETWLIPTVKSHVALTAKALQTVQDFGGPDDLLIVYYGGHGLINDVRQGVWTCDADLNHGSLLWYAIQPLFEQADSDVLLLLDCCAAASGAPTTSESTSVTETIAACGFETWAPRPGRHSFTNTLIAVLEDWKGRRAFTAAMLHCEILQRLRHEQPERYRNTNKFEYRKSPIHVLSTNDRHARSVELCPRKLPPRLPGDVIAAAAEVPSARGASLSKSARNVELDNDGSSVGASVSENANSANQTGDLYDMDSLATTLDIQ